MKKIKFIIVGLVILVVLLEGIHVYLSNRISEKTIEVATLREQIEVLDEKTISLRTELLQYSSFDRISSRAAELGFQDSKDGTLMVNSPMPMARVQ